MPWYERSGAKKDPWDHAGYRELVRREFRAGRPVLGATLRETARRHDAEVRRRGLAEPLLGPALEAGRTARAAHAPAGRRAPAPGPRPAGRRLPDGRVLRWVPA